MNKCVYIRKEMSRFKIIFVSISLFLIMLPQFSFSTTDEDCLVCHKNPNLKNSDGRSLYIDSEKLRSSIHGKAGFSCVDCHIDLMEVKDFPHPAKLKAVSCGQCHEEIENDYLEGVHGKDYAKGIKDVPVCTDCHNEHDITSPQDLSSPVYATKVADVCSRCHDDEALAQQYGFLTARLKTYSRSFHGIASKFGETRVANCASCHGFHDIRLSTDPRSSIHPDNLPQTCGKCHPGAGANFARGKIHVVSEKLSNKWAYFIKTFYIIMITVAIPVFLIFITADLFHRLVRRRAKP
jgi:predicted CXXCH cytochrome family protein